MYCITPLSHSVYEEDLPKGHCLTQFMRKTYRRATYEQLGLCMDLLGSGGEFRSGDRVRGLQLREGIPRARCNPSLRPPSFETPLT